MPYIDIITYVEVIISKLKFVVFVENHNLLYSTVSGEILARVNFGQIRSTKNILMNQILADITRMPTYIYARILLVD